MALRVNGQIVPRQAIEFELGRLIRFYSEHMSEPEIRRQMPALKARAREQAIGVKLLMDQAAQMDFVVTPERVEAKLSALVAEAGGREKFNQMLQRQNLTEDGLRQNIRPGCRLDMLVEKIAAGVPDPTEKELRDHFEEHAAEYAKPPRASAQHILIRVEAGDTAAKEAATQKLTEIRKKADDGANFGDLAAAHSECPSGRKAAGSLGWFARGMMVEPFDEAVFSMAVGALSGIIESPLGLHLIRKTGHEDGGAAEFDEVRDKIRDFLRHVARGQAITSYVNDLRARATIEEDESDTRPQP